MFNGLHNEHLHHPVNVTLLIKGVYPVLHHWPPPPPQHLQKMLWSTENKSMNLLVPGIHFKSQHHPRPTSPSSFCTASSVSLGWILSARQWGKAESVGGSTRVFVGRSGRWAGGASLHDSNQHGEKQQGSQQSVYLQGQTMKQNEMRKKSKMKTGRLKKNRKSAHYLFKGNFLQPSHLCTSTLPVCSVHAFNSYIS